MAGRYGGTAVRRHSDRTAGAILPVFALLLFTAVPQYRLFAQAIAAGRVIRPEAADSTPVPGVRVVLHRVGTEAQGPVDSTLSGAGGRFRFRFTPDSGALYLLSARYGGLEYFSAPVRLDSAPPDTGVRVVVYDTSSTTPVGLSARHLVVPRPGEDGTREVLDLIVLLNGGRLARVAPDTLGASWSGPLPAASEGLDVGESDVSPEAIERRGDSVFLAAPIAPGEKQLSLQYHLPGDRTEAAFPLGREGGTVNVLLEEPGATARADGLTLADTQVIGGRNFRRWTGQLAAGTVIDVRLPSTAGTPLDLLGALVAAVVVGLAVATWQILARRPIPAAASPDSAFPGPLLDRIAALDARYLGRETEVEATEWSRYQADRARLKAELEAMLAARGPAR
ncbi:MAG: carboxypeptidase regulatory-like domain-containing protein [Gemmatimonadales bacterium]|nr:carboxypeptidase regulatory-like domain-containing protein [Gemmatimonadales bacterium]